MELTVPCKAAVPHAFGIHPPRSLSITLSRGTSSQHKAGSLARWYIDHLVRLRLIRVSSFSRSTLRSPSVVQPRGLKSVQDVLPQADGFERVSCQTCDCWYYLAWPSARLRRTKWCIYGNINSPSKHFSPVVSRPCLHIKSLAPYYNKLLHE